LQAEADLDTPGPEWQPCLLRERPRINFAPLPSCKLTKLDLIVLGIDWETPPITPLPAASWREENPEEDWMDLRGEESTLVMVAVLMHRCGWNSTGVD
jgi:hypothetical protein